MEIGVLFTYYSQRLTAVAQHKMWKISLFSVSPNDNKKLNLCWPDGVQITKHNKVSSSPLAVMTL